jgi:hypothetical protein
LAASDRPAAEELLARIDTYNMRWLLLIL